MLQTAVLGAGKIGKYHVREFAKAGVAVRAILGSSPESTRKTASEIYKEFGVEVNPYWKLEELLEHKNLDIVSICTPPEMHHSQTKMCLNNNLHVLCEKPFVEGNSNNYLAARYLFDLANKKGKVLSVNTQWASIVDLLHDHIFENRLERLTVYMEPGYRGKELLTDHLPHANSILIGLIPGGTIKEINFPIRSYEELKVDFVYGADREDCEVEYHFKFRADRPRNVLFKLNDREWRREVDQEKGYQQYFISDNIKIPIEDPLRFSIKRFVGACKGQGAPLVEKDDILQNIMIGERIISKY